MQKKPRNEERVVPEPRTGSTGHDRAKRASPDQNVDAGGEPMAGGRNSGRSSAETRRNDRV